MQIPIQEVELIDALVEDPNIPEPFHNMDLVGDDDNDNIEVEGEDDVEQPTVDMDDQY